MFTEIFNTKERKKEIEVAQLCLTLCNPMDCSLSGSSVHGISQARVLEWIAISFSRGSSWPRNRTWVSHIADRLFTVWATREAWKKYNVKINAFSNLTVLDALGGPILNQSHSSVSYTCWFHASLAAPEILYLQTLLEGLFLLCLGW